jgi:hypothetical protein
MKTEAEYLEAMGIIQCDNVESLLLAEAAAGTSEFV